MEGAEDDKVLSVGFWPVDEETTILLLSPTEEESCSSSCSQGDATCSIFNLN